MLLYKIIIPELVLLYKTIFPKLLLLCRIIINKLVFLYKIIIPKLVLLYRIITPKQTSLIILEPLVRKKISRIVATSFLLLNVQSSAGNEYILHDFVCLLPSVISFWWFLSPHWFYCEQLIGRRISLIEWNSAITERGRI